jgi:hypothetical protein
MNNIQSRVVELERQSHKQKKIIWSLGILSLAIALFGFTQGGIEELTLRKLVITDQEGRARIVLSAGFETNPNSASVVYLDPDQKIRYWSGTEGVENVNTSYYDEKEQLAQSQCVVRGGGSAMSLFSEKGTVQAELSWSRNEKDPPRLIVKQGEILGPTRMLLQDSDRHTRIAVDADYPSGNAVLFLMDEEQSQGIYLRSNLDGESTISVNEGNGRAGWIVAADKEHGCMMNLSDELGTDRISLMVRNHGLNGLILFDATSQPQAIMSSTQSGDSAFRVGTFSPKTNKEKE